MIRNFRFSLSISALLLLATASACKDDDKKPLAVTLPGVHTEASRNQKVLATVNGADITEAQLKLYIESRKQQHPLARKQTRQELLKEFIIQRLLSQEAVKAGIHKKSEIANKVSFYYNNLLATKMTRKKLEQFRVTQQDIEKEYRKRYRNNQSQHFRTRHILVKTRAEARQIITQLKQGADFAILARKHSIGPSAKTGGALAWFSQDKILAPFYRAVRKLHPGSYTTTPVQTKYGWHVILLEETRYQPAPPLKLMTSRIYTYLLEKRFRRYTDTLYKQAVIKYQ